MINTIPPGDQKRTHIIGRSQGYLGLAVNFATVTNEATGQEFPCLTTAYKPTPAELHLLNSGAPVKLQLLYVRPTEVLVRIGETVLDLAPIVVSDSVQGHDANALAATYRPTRQMLDHLNADGSLVLYVVGPMQHPPVCVWV